ncbi:Cysteine-rich venom protein TRI1 [Auxenochlorella protothecoides]|uniref:Cysteine-rich venom protein TRI1 n=1 Tax=Auxenochlorella protothecoides TaxID=3075 RepID=A0A087SP33_AUXPR|nr:Cysteine-rich venom protein TRI1 [Auxenochlorella protothecoides]KFM27487.1 Cysteine-rich venom protein TRI1 [Auxenochlorella protothecoides]
MVLPGWSLLVALIATVVVAPMGSEAAASRALLATQAPLCDTPELLLQIHNLARSEHSVGRLTWNETLARVSEEYAEKCHYGHAPKPNRSGFGKYAGENILYTRNIRVTCEHVWKAWYYNEARSYVLGTGGDTGHFTQMVWKGSKEVGCGFVKCPGYVNNLNAPGYWTYLVCRYYPAGNVIGDL